MNKYDIANKLKQIGTRSELVNFRNSLEKEEKLNADVADLCSEIEHFLSQPPCPFGGMDKELVSRECHSLAEKYSNFGWVEAAEEDIRILEQILSSLSNEDLIEQFRSPIHAKCTIHKQLIGKLQYDTEYDVQQMLYWILRIVFPNCQIETHQNDGYAGLRTDISISENVIIEVKSTTRDSLIENKLIDEIVADEGRFDQKFHYFFIYDAKRVIKDKEQFIKNYEMRGRRIRGKQQCHLAN